MDQVTEDVVTVTRHNPVSHETIILVAYTAFRPSGLESQAYVRPLRVQGELQAILFEMEQHPLNDRSAHSIQSILAIPSNVAYNT